MGDFRNVAELFESAASAMPHKGIIRAKTATGWQTTTLSAWRQQSGSWAKGLIALGHAPGDRVHIVANTCQPWLIADMAIMLAAGATVPIYQSALDSEAAYICGNSGGRFAFVEDAVQLEKLLKHRQSLPHLKKIICFNPSVQLPAPDQEGRTTLRVSDLLPAGDDWVISLAQLAELGATIADSALEQRRGSVSPDDICTIVYTSGTTGQPKGVVLTHLAFLSEVEAALQSLDVRPDDSMLLFLPLAHIFAKVVSFVCMAVRTEIIIPQSIATLLVDMAESKPTVLPAVPRIFEKVHNKILGGVHAANPARQRIFQAALATGREVSKLQQRGKQPTGALAARHWLAHKLVFQKIHAIFGGRIRGFISGAAPLSRELSEFFHACGLLILEGYGLTETCAAVTCNRLDRYKFGTVGLPMPGIDVRIALDGEILVKGPVLMREYYNNPEATAEVIIDGWFHTGDIGEIDADGFLRITDRKKDIIVTAGGKNVAPQNIESHIKHSPFISQVMVYGDRRKFLSALLTLDEEAIKVWATEHNIIYASLAELTQNASVYKLIDQTIAERNRTLASYETIKKFAILERDLTVEDGDLTPSLKMRRKEVTRKYQDLLDSFYSEHY